MRRFLLSAALVLSSGVPAGAGVITGGTVTYGAGESATFDIGDHVLTMTSAMTYKGEPIKYVFDIASSGSVEDWDIVFVREGSAAFAAGVERNTLGVMLFGVRMYTPGRHDFVLPVFEKAPLAANGLLEVTITSAPEPGSMALAAGGLPAVAALAVRRRSRRGTAGSRPTRTTGLPG